VPDAALPTVSVVIATLNAERDLEACLAAVAAQDYPADRVQLVVGDAGSTDRTLEIVARHGGVVVPNPRRTAEAGKAAALTAATGELVLLLDSDNIVIGTDWLRRMAAPFVADPDVMGCEPARFHYDPDDNVVNRWHALLGAADPLTIYTGNYARDCVLTGTWTDLPHRSVAHDGWERIVLDPRAVPVLGANGFVMRRRAYELVPVGDYLFDLDHVHELVARGHAVFPAPTSPCTTASCPASASTARRPSGARTTSSSSAPRASARTRGRRSGPAASPTSRCPPRSSRRSCATPRAGTRAGPTSGRGRGTWRRAG
jgi:hypothetical protein